MIRWHGTGLGHMTETMQHGKYWAATCTNGTTAPKFVCRLPSRNTHPTTHFLSVSSRTRSKACCASEERPPTKCQAHKQFANEELKGRNTTPGSPSDLKRVSTGLGPPWQESNMVCIPLKFQGKLSMYRIFPGASCHALGVIGGAHTHTHTHNANKCMYVQIMCVCVVKCVARKGSF